MFKIEFDTSNDAFQDDCRGEIARILAELSEAIIDGKEPCKVIDYNGNAVGKITWAI